MMIDLGKVTEQTKGPGNFLEQPGEVGIPE